MDIEINSELNIRVLDNIARAILGSAISGVSTEPNKTRIHLIDESQDIQDKATKILNNFGLLPVDSNTISMNEGDTDPIITCNHPNISSDINVGYMVLFDDKLYDSGLTPVVAGIATLNLVLPTTGTYEIHMARLSGSLVSGSVTIIVNEG